MPGAAFAPSPNTFVTTFAGAPGLVIGGPTSGTFAYVVPPETDGRVMMGSRVIDQLVTGVDPSAIETVRSGAADEIVSETSFQGTPYRVLSAGVDAPDGRYVTQVVADRTAEVRTLQVLLVVLIGGGAARAPRRARAWAGCTPSGRWSRSATRCAASASSPPTPRTSFGRHSRSCDPAPSTCAGIARSRSGRSGPR